MVLYIYEAETTIEHSTENNHIVTTFSYSSFIVFTMMKLFVLAAVVVGSSVLAAPADTDYHETLDDEFDFSALSVDQIRDITLCLCDDGPCNDLLNSYKQHMAVAIQESCKRCNPSQKRIALVYFDRLQKELPGETQRCAAKYDPKGMYFSTFYNNLKNA